VVLRAWQSSAMGGGVAWCSQRTEPDVEGVAVVDDVAGASQSGANEGAGLVVGAGEGSGRV
jgi:hypothetical protein